MAIRVSVPRNPAIIPAGMSPGMAAQTAAMWRHYWRSWASGGPPIGPGLPGEDSAKDRLGLDPAFWAASQAIIGNKTAPPSRMADSANTGDRSSRITGLPRPVLPGRYVAFGTGAAFQYNAPLVPARIPTAAVPGHVFILGAYARVSASSGSNRLFAGVCQNSGTTNNLGFGVAATSSRLTVQGAEVGGISSNSLQWDLGQEFQLALGKIRDDNSTQFALNGETDSGTAATGLPNPALFREAVLNGFRPQNSTPNLQSNADVAFAFCYYGPDLDLRDLEVDILDYLNDFAERRGNIPDILVSDNLVWSWTSRAGTDRIWSDQRAEFSALNYPGPTAFVASSDAPAVGSRVGFRDAPAPDSGLGIPLPLPTFPSEGRITVEYVASRDTTSQIYALRGSSASNDRRIRLKINSSGIIGIDVGNIANNTGVTQQEGEFYKLVLDWVSGSPGTFEYRVFDKDGTQIGFTSSASAVVDSSLNSPIIQETGRRTYERITVESQGVMLYDSAVEGYPGVPLYEVPADLTDLSKDILGNDLEFRGPAPADALADGGAGLFLNNEYLEIPSVANYDRDDWRFNCYFWVEGIAAERTLLSATNPILIADNVTGNFATEIGGARVDLKIDIETDVYYFVQITKQGDEATFVFISPDGLKAVRTVAAIGQGDRVTWTLGARSGGGTYHRGFLIDARLENLTTGLTEFYYPIDEREGEVCFDVSPNKRSTVVTNYNAQFRAFKQDRSAWNATRGFTPFEYFNGADAGYRYTDQVIGDDETEIRFSIILEANSSAAIAPLARSSGSMFFYNAGTGGVRVFQGLEADINLELGKRYDFVVFPQTKTVFVNGENVGTRSGSTTNQDTGVFTVGYRVNGGSPGARFQGYIWDLYYQKAGIFIRGYGLESDRMNDVNGVVSVVEKNPGSPAVGRVPALEKGGGTTLGETVTNQPGGHNDFGGELDLTNGEPEIPLQTCGYGVDFPGSALQGVTLQERVSIPNARRFYLRCTVNLRAFTGSILGRASGGRYIRVRQNDMQIATGSGTVTVAFAESLVLGRTYVLELFRDDANTWVARANGVAGPETLNGVGTLSPLDLIGKHGATVSPFNGILRNLYIRGDDNDGNADVEHQWHLCGDYLDRGKLGGAALRAHGVPSIEETLLKDSNRIETAYGKNDGRGGGLFDGSTSLIAIPAVAPDAFILRASFVPGTDWAGGTVERPIIGASMGFAGYVAVLENGSIKFALGGAELILPAALGVWAQGTRYNLEARRQADGTASAIVNGTDFGSGAALGDPGFDVIGEQGFLGYFSGLLSSVYYFDNTTERFYPLDVDARDSISGQDGTPTGVSFPVATTSNIVSEVRDFDFFAFNPRRA